MLLATSGLAMPAGAVTPHATISAASEYVYRGLTRSRGDASVQAAASLETDAGWGAGLTAATVNMNPGPGATSEFSAYVSRRMELSRDWVLSAQLARYEYPHDSHTIPYDYTEGVLAASWRRLVTLSVAVSPDYSFYSTRGIALDRTAINWTLAAAYPLRPWLELTGGYGRADLRDLFDAQYDYWSFGMRGSWARASVALTYVDTDSMAARLFRRTAVDRQWVLAVGYRIR